MSVQRTLRSSPVGKVLAALLVALMMATGTLGELEPTESSIALMSTQVGVVRLGPDVESDSWLFLVDDRVTEIYVQVFASASDVPITIVAANGATINEATIDGLGGTYLAFDNRENENCVFLSTLDLAGFHDYMLFPVQGFGTYEIQFGAMVGLTEDVGIIAAVTTDSTIGANAFTGEHITPLGIPVVVNAAVFDGAMPITDASVTAYVQPPTGDEVLVTLLDNGEEGDSEVGDGVYSALLDFAEIGEYRVVTEITRTGGRSTAFARQAGTRFRILEPCAALTGTFTDQGIDDDGDDLYDRIVIEAGVDVTTSMGVGIFMTLETPTGQTLLARGYAELTGGSTSIGASIDATTLTEDGPYTIKDVDLLCYGEEGAMPSSRLIDVDQLTQPYDLSDLARPALELTGSQSDFGVHEDGDGDVDAVQVNIEIEAEVEGVYGFYARLVDMCGNELEVLTGQRTLQARPLSNWLELYFDGSLIGANGVDGPYVLSDLSVWGQGAELYKHNVRETNPYVATQFDSYAPPPDCNNNGVHDLCDVTWGTSEDCNYNENPDECDPMDIEFDGDVDLWEITMFQRCFGATDYACLCLFDRAEPADVVGLSDYSLVVAQLSGPAGAGGRGSQGPRDGGGEPPDREEGARETPPDPWHYEDAEVAMTVTAVGGGDPVTVLSPNTSYEVHYLADAQGVNEYELFAVTQTEEVSFANVVPAASGPWANTGMFTWFEPFKDFGLLVPAFGFPEGYYRYDMVTDDSEAPAEGHICTFTTGIAGELNLHLFMWWVDAEAMRIVRMETRGTYEVSGG